MRERLAPFDPGNAQDAMAESFRRQICHMILDAQRTTIFREMDPGQQAEAFMAGTVTGIVGCLFAMIQPDGRDELVKAIADYLPHARLNVEDLLAGEHGDPAP